MIFGIALAVIGLALFVYGTRETRLQVRAMGAGAMAFGVVTVALPLILG